MMEENDPCGVPLKTPVEWIVAGSDERVVVTSWSCLVYLSSTGAAVLDCAGRCTHSFARCEEGEAHACCGTPSRMQFSVPQGRV